MPTKDKKQKEKGPTSQPPQPALEDAASEEESIFKGLIEMAPFPISISRMEDGRFLLVNKRLCKITGFSMQEVIGRTAEELGIYADPAERDAMIEAIRSGDGKVQSFETRMKGKGGAPLNSNRLVKAIRFQGQDCLLIMTTYFGSLTKAQLALSQSQDRFKNILNSITESYYEVDIGGHFTFFNDSVTTLLGYSPSELQGMSYQAYTTSENARKVYKIFNEVYKGGSAVKFVEYGIRRKDGTFLQVEASASLLRDPAGKPVGFYGLLRDRTEQKKAEEALRQSEESYRSLLELAPDAITVGRMDDGRYLQVNDAFCRLSGYSAEQAIGRSALELNLYANPEDRANMLASMQRQGRVEGLEMRFRAKSGMLIDALVSARQIRFRGQECLLVIVTNITSLKTTQEALRQSEEKHSSILEEMEEGYYEIDLQGSFTYFNQATLKIHGHSADELIGMNYKHYLFPEQIKKNTRIFNQIYKTGIPGQITDYQIIRKDGSVCFAEISGYPLRDAQGKIIGFWGITRDRTVQKKAEMALQKSEEQYRLLVDYATDGIYITQKGRIKFHNPKTVAITGYTDDELADMAFADIVHPEDKQSIYDPQQRKMETKQSPDVFSFRILNKEEEVRWVELSAIGITWEGQPAALNFLRDVTTQKQMEAQLLQARKMEAVGTLAGGIAHDFNNLLMGIKGNTALAMLDIDKTNPLYEKLNSIEQYVKAGADLTRQLLGTARGGKYDPKPTHFNTLVDTSIDLFGRTKKEVRLHKKYAQDLWAVEVDRGQMEQVLLNLYVNAWHAMPNGGDLYLETRNVLLDDYYAKPYGVAPGKFVKLGVTDTGAGIDPKNLKRIFDPFFTTKGMGMGTGLGLSSAYGIISNHGGIITVYSEVGSGATFNIYLPASSKEVAEGDERKVEIVKGDETVLFIDDEAGIVEVGRLILQRLGYTVIASQDGREAIEIYRQQKEKIDVVIVDMIMPGMSGGDTFNAIKAINPEVKVILSSGYSVNGQAKAILERGCNGFIQKPFSMQDLSAKLREILDQKP